MTGVRLSVGGDATDEEVAAITAAVSVFLTGGPAATDPRPSAYRSRWRAAAIGQAAERPPLMFGVPSPTRPAES